MEFRKYQHIERFGTDEVEDINYGTCHIFYKIDGTNSSLWLDDDGNLAAGSRNRTLTLENDNAGFFAWASQQQNIKDYFLVHPTHRLYGEWLVPHSLKTYRDDSWRRFYVFDVIKTLDDVLEEYLPYEMYKDMVEEFGIDYVPPIAIITNPTYEQLIYCLDKTGQFLVTDGAGKGEGIVIKNYSYKNKYGRQTWAKIVCNEFKEKNAKAFGVPEIGNTDLVEQKIIDEFCTTAFIEKEYAKIVNDMNGWRSEYIPRLLSTVFTSLVKEESYNFVKKFKMPKIDFKTLNAMVIQKVKQDKRNLFA